MSDQLDIFTTPANPAPADDADPEPEIHFGAPKGTQLTELPGETFEDIFGGTA